MQRCHRCLLTNINKIFSFGFFLLNSILIYFSFYKLANKHIKYGGRSSHSFGHNLLHFLRRNTLTYESPIRDTELQHETQCNLLSAAMAAGSMMTVSAHADSTARVAAASALGSVAGTALGKTWGQHWRNNWCCVRWCRWCCCGK